MLGVSSTSMTTSPLPVTPAIGAVEAVAPLASGGWFRLFPGWLEADAMGWAPSRAGKVSGTRTFRDSVCEGVVGPAFSATEELIVAVSIVIWVCSTAMIAPSWPGCSSCVATRSLVPPAAEDGPAASGCSNAFDAESTVPRAAELDSGSSATKGLRSQLRLQLSLTKRDDLRGLFDGSARLLRSFQAIFLPFIRGFERVVDTFLYETAYTTGECARILLESLLPGLRGVSGRHRIRRLIQGLKR